MTKALFGMFLAHWQEWETFQQFRTKATWDNFSDFSYSREISNTGTARIIRSLPALKQIRLSCCRKLTVDLLNSASSDKHVLILATFCEHEPNPLTTASNQLFSIVADPERTSFADIRRYSFEKHVTRTWRWRCLRYIHWYKWVIQETQFDNIKNKSFALSHTWIHHLKQGRRSL